MVIHEGVEVTTGDNGKKIVCVDSIKYTLTEAIYLCAIYSDGESVLRHEPIELGQGDE